MNVSADPGTEIADIVAKLCGEGRYKSEKDVLQAAVRLLEYLERKLAELHHKIDAGLRDVEEGRIHTADEVFGRLKARNSADSSA